jgi:hypothetical protein
MMCTAAAQHWNTFLQHPVVQRVRISWQRRALGMVDGLTWHHISITF